MKKKRSAWVRHLALTLFCLGPIALSPVASAQTMTTGDVTGLVTDATGAGVPSAVVTIKNVDTNEARTANSDGTGRYRFSLLKPG
ncbi:MAG TPA: carboxypeptidase-like regulatory domain-containing protein, partial [Bryobacteraceae bacterium]|nr:carboxypeptidase-like regulatory domain-containing protein [Bryobacteraceae bacterium]